MKNGRDIHAENQYTTEQVIKHMENLIEEIETLLDSGEQITKGNISRLLYINTLWRFKLSELIASAELYHVNNIR